MFYSRLSQRRKAVSSTVLAGIVVVVIAVAAVGAYLTLAPSPQASSSTTSPTSSSSVTHLTTSTTPTSSSPSTKSSSSTSTTTSTSSTSSSTSTSTTSSTSTSTTSSAFSFDFVLGSAPDTILLAVGSTVIYPRLTLGPLPAASSGSETVTLNSTAPTGLTVKFATNQVKLITDIKASVVMTINSSQSLTPGDYKITVGAQYGTSSKTSDITVKVVQYLVMESGNNFSPFTLAVKQGTTVYWINMDSPGGGDPGVHNVVFSSGSSAHSPDMATYDTYSYTFTAPGTYSYFCAFHPGMKGTITVTA